MSADKGAIKVSGNKGELTWQAPDGIEVSVEDGTVKVERSGSGKHLRAMHGTTRAIIANMIEGVTNGYVKELELHGVGFRANLQGKAIVLALGYAHEIRYEPPEGVTIEVNNQTEIKISGIDKQKVGQAASMIRSYYPVEPYKGKGVRYKDEVVRTKVGKAVS